MTRVDRRQLRFNQALLVLGTAASLVLRRPEPVWLLTLLFLLSFTRWDPLRALKRSLKIPSDPVEEDPRPHRFARALGTLFLSFASLAFATGQAWLGYLLALTVGLLAAINLTFRFCLGCFLYYQFRLLRHRLGLN